MAQNTEIGEKASVGLHDEPIKGTAHTAAERGQTATDKCANNPTLIVELALTQVRIDMECLLSPLIP